MNHMFRVLCAIALVAAGVNTAAAQCKFNAPGKAKGMKASMVRAFVGCPSTSGGPGHVNTETSGGTPACDPVAVLSLEGDVTPYLLDPQTGSCDVQMKARIEKDCSLLKDPDGKPLGLPVGACSVTYVKARCQGITHADGTPIQAHSDSGWSLSTLTRFTTNDGINGDITLIDFPIIYAFNNPNDGKIRLDSNSAVALAGILVDPSGAALPTCTSAQWLRATIKDPNGLPFAVLGGSTRGAAE